MNWNQEELEQWALAARQKEEDNLALLKSAPHIDSEHARPKHSERPWTCRPACAFCSSDATEECDGEGLSSPLSFD